MLKALAYYAGYVALFVAIALFNYGIALNVIRFDIDWFLKGILILSTALPVVAYEIFGRHLKIRPTC